jgi:hypothetical protein
MQRTWLHKMILYAYYALTLPIAAVFILSSAKIHSAYRMTIPKKLWLAFRMFWTTLRVPSGSSYKTTLAMALKILETPPNVEGMIVECGTWKGSSAANLSLVCEITGRRLQIYDSFEGLPVAPSNDRLGVDYTPGDYCGTLEEVKSNIRKYGSFERCDFIKGWFDETLPGQHSPVLLAYLDVDYESSLETCIRYLWLRLVDHGYIFIDEMVSINYCALFYSERYWQETFNTIPPGLIGAGSGLALGEYYIGPHEERFQHPLQHVNAAAYTFKGMDGSWTYYPEQIGSLSVPSTKE